MNPFEREVIDRLARIETRLDGLVDTSKDHSDRLETLEALRVRLLSWSTVVATVVSGGATYVLPLIFNHGR